jgi:predicted phage baseplate assembly protein
MTLPLENLDDKSFEDLVSDAVARIRVYAPEWTDYNKTDPGITLIELLAWIAEMQIYRLNRVSERSRLKFLKLLGINGIRPARAATVELNFTMQSSPATTSSIRIPAFTQLAASDPATGEDIIFETDRDLNLVNIGLDAILTIPKGGSIIDNTDANSGENVSYSAFGIDPVMGDALYLGLDLSPKGQELAVSFYLFQDLPQFDRCAADSHSSASLVWEYYTGGDWKNDISWKALARKNALENNDWEVVLDETCDLTMSGIVWVRIEENIASTLIGGYDLFWLRIRIDMPGYFIPPVIKSLLLNVISGTQKATFKDRFSSTGLPGFKIILGHTPIVEGSLKLGIFGESSAWTEVKDLDASRPGDRHYILDLQTGIISFGDGINGRIPSEGGDNIIVTFSSGGGIRGNVAPGTIKKVLDNGLAAKVQVTNRRAAVGGEDPGTIEEAILRARRELRSTYRAVTPEDYEFIAKNTPGLNVARVKAMPFYHPSIPWDVPDTVTLVVVPSSSKPMPVPSREFLRAVYRYVDKHRTMGTELFVIGPVYITVTVKATVIMAPLYRSETAVKSVLERLNSFFSPINGGGPDKEGWPFGRPIYISELYALLDQITGVDYIKKLTLIADGKETDGDVKIPDYGLACSGTHLVVAYSEEDYNKIKEA